jgi:N-acetylmuramic acid 6-phosphate etherase
MKPNSITESPSLYDHLESMSTLEILENINREDQKVAQAVQEVIPKIEALINQLVPRFEAGGRLIYVGAGTSGRLGILDASEIPPTYGMEENRVIGIIAGGDRAIRKGIEFAEDNIKQAEIDLSNLQINSQDTLVGIAASGTTPYVISAVNYAKKCGALTGCITNNPDTPLAKAAEFPIEIIVGPEFVTGSTRMKSGTSQKLVLNMISTALMVKFGRVKGNKMVNMQLTNNKLVKRGVRFLIEELNISAEEAAKLLEKYGSVKEAIAHY